MSAALLLDLGNRRLKLTRVGFRQTGHPVLELELDAHGRLEDGRWLAARVELGCKEDVPVFASSTHPRARTHLEQQILPPHPTQWIGPENWPLAVESRGTGSDRVLAALAAWKRAGSAAIVADLGTAWTLDLISAEGVFRGGAIGPGLKVQIEALARACPHLEAPNPIPNSDLPQTTADAVGAGTYGAMAALLESMAESFSAGRSSPPKRFLSGGDAVALENWLGSDWERVDHLVLEGLDHCARHSASFRT